MCLCNSNVSQTEVWGRNSQLPEAMGYGRAPSRYAIFVIFLKKSYFNAIGPHFARVQSHLKEIDF